MELKLKEGEKVIITGAKGKFAPYLVVVGLDSGAACQTDSGRDKE